MKLVSLSIVLAAPLLFGQVKITSQPDKVEVEIDGKPFTEFIVSGADIAKPILFPVRAATGTYVTRQWPLVKGVAGEAHDHPHQRGLWFGHGNVNGADFWANEAENHSAKAGKIVPAGPVSVKSGGKKNQAGTVDATFNWQDPQGNVLLTEHRVMTFYPDASRRIVDFEITLTPKQKVTFADDKEGTFAMRIRPELQEEKGTGHIVNADGLETEKQAWGKPSNWVDYYGKVGDEQIGIAIFDHPANPRHPNRWHVRGYGLFSLNPFGVAAFTGNKADTNPMTVESGNPLRYRFRVIIHPGDVKSARIADLYTAYTKGKLD